MTEKPHPPRRTTVRRRRRRLVALALVAVTGTFWFTRDRNPLGHWRSDEGRQAYAASYARAMALLPPPTRLLDLPTDFGTVHVARFGPTDGTSGAGRSGADAAADVPVVLMPGRTSGIPMWASNLADLAAHRTVYAVDALGDAGLSVQTRPLRDADDQAAWLDQVIAQLGAPAVHLIGHSFGGSLATTYALRHPEHVATLTLLEPILVFQGLRWQLYVGATVASVPFVPQSWRSRALAGIGGAEELDLDDPVARMISDAAQHYAAVLPTPQRPSDAELRRLTMPVLVALAENSAVHDAAAALQVARSTLPHARTALWPGTTHSLPMEAAPALDRAVLDFLSSPRG